MSNKKTQSTTKYPVNLLDTPFPMRGNLPQREPQWIEQWQKKGVYQVVRKARANQPKFILHDGPPYANGELHVGHALNKILKDIVLKSKSLAGFDTPYIPGWDCHGMPIELAIEKKFGKHLDTESVQKHAREYANKQIEQQRKDFMRLGVLADWSNPYKTMSFQNEADELRALAKMLENGFIYRGLKPVYWCFDCRSALAEAEIEYKDKTDETIDIIFPFAQLEKTAQAFGLERLPKQEGGAVIWTTTPWTIPANQALNVHPDVEYVLVDTARGLLIFAENRLESCLAEYQLEGKVIAKTLGKELVNLEFFHPLASLDPGYQRTSPIYSAEYVTTDSGTGIVHSSPAYGVEDFLSCKQHGLQDDEIINPVTSDGHYASHLPLFAGKTIWQANPLIINALDQANTLIKKQTYTHSYMHCWRHKTPVIYRATSQWFVSMDRPSKSLHGSLREIAIKGIENTQFYPSWGKQRLLNMVSNRPDWTISRQRQWGVPMAFLIHKETGELHPRSAELLEVIAQHIEKGGIEVWQQLKVSDLIGTEEATLYEKNQDTLDVWFDSGTTHWHVMRGSHQAVLDFPADLYLEGSDQHRGWFQSSLLTSSMLNGQPPYRAILTHGFAVDGQGRKMSKSLGNGIALNDLTNRLGAEIVRLWVASTDYSAELAISEEILKRVTESYRRIRNTLRFLLANLSDFDLAANALPVKEWLEIDRYALADIEQLQQEIIAHYEKFEFHPIVAKLQTYCSENLGGFYLDILKDRLYTTAPNSLARRSAQNALYHIIESMLRLIAPFLSFTAEEAYQVLHPEQLTLFTETYYQFPENIEQVYLLDKWQKLRHIRANVIKALEEARTAGRIGSSLQAEVHLFVDAASFKLLNSLQDELKFLFITSSAKVHLVDQVEQEKIEVHASEYEKCERCWHYSESVGQHAEHPHLCGRCNDNLYHEGETRSFV